MTFPSFVTTESMSTESAHFNVLRALSPPKATAIVAAQGCEVLPCHAGRCGCIWAACARWAGTCGWWWWLCANECNRITNDCHVACSR